MLFRDDEDDFPSQSSAEFLTRADHGKKEQRERNAAQKGDLLALQRAMLRGQVKPDASARQATAQEKGDHTQEENVRHSADEDQVSVQGTKTLQQEADEQLQEADESDTAHTLIDKAKQHQDAKRQSEEEYQQDAG
jgi:hypothetical protein